MIGRVTWYCSISFALDGVSDDSLELVGDVSPLVLRVADEPQRLAAHELAVVAVVVESVEPFDEAHPVRDAADRVEARDAELQLRAGDQVHPARAPFAQGAPAGRDLRDAAGHPLHVRQP